MNRPSQKHKFIIASEGKSKERNYWLKQLAGKLHKGRFPACRPLDRAGEEPAASLPLTLSGQECASLLRLGKGNDQALHVILLAALAMVLERYSGYREFLLGMPIYRQEIRGEFTNTLLPIRVSIDAAATVKDLLMQVRQTVIDACRHQVFPIGTLLDRLTLLPAQGPPRLFDTGLLLRNIHDETYLRDSRPMMDFRLERQQDRLTGELLYHPGVYRENDVEQIGRHFLRLLRDLPARLDTPPGDIELLSPEEKKHLIYELNPPAAAIPEHPTIDAWIGGQAAGSPDRIAVVHAGNNHQVSYSELNRRANWLARLLRERGLGPNHLAAIRMKRAPEMPVALLAVWKAGGIALPLEVDGGKEESTPLPAAANARFLLTDSGTAAGFPGVEQFLRLDALTGWSPGHGVGGPAVNPASRSQGAQPAWVLFTPGTVGPKKGVLVEHRGMLTHWHAKNLELQTGSHSVAAQTAPPGFYLFPWQLFGPLLRGGKTVIYPQAMTREPAALAPLPARDRITLLEGVPSCLSTLLEQLTISGTPVPLPLEYLVITGETAGASLVRRWAHCYPGMSILHAYGSAETLGHITHHRVTAPPEEGALPIGKPLPNYRVIIADDHMRLCPRGMIGEICVSGQGIGRGYLDDQGQTADRFPGDFPAALHSIDPVTAGPFVKTGDLGRWLPDGTIGFYGRKEHRVTIRGERFPLGGIEELLVRHPQVQEAVVEAPKDPGGDGYLCAYIVTPDREPPDVTAIREFLAEGLPDHMVPQTFKHLPLWPLTADSRVNRGALPFSQAVESGQLPVLPREQLEARISEIWCDILGVETIGIHQDFFQLGGDSIKAIQLAARMQKHGIPIKIGDIFQAPTIDGVARISRDSHRVIHQGPVTGGVPLSPVQQAFFRENSPHTHHYNQSAMIYREAGLEETAVQRVLDKLAVHHDMLRAVYTAAPAAEGGEVFQRVRDLDQPLAHLEVVDMEPVPGWEAEVEAHGNRIQASLNLEQGPLVKAALFKTGGGGHLLLVLHHLVIEGISWRILWEDFITAYRQIEGGEDIALPRKSDSFKSWVEALQTFAGGPDMDEEIQYWRTVEALTVEPLPSDREPGEGGDRFEFKDTLSITLEAEETRTLLREVHQAYNTEINEILLTALTAALRQWTGSASFCFLLEGHGREDIIPDLDITRTIGWFASEYPVVLDTGASGHTGTEIKTVKETLRRIPHKGMGYGLLKYLAPPAKRDGLPFRLKPEICFNYLGEVDDLERQFEDFTLSWLKGGEAIDPGAPFPFKILAEGSVANGRMTFDFSYNRRRYRRASVQRLAEAFRGELRRIMEHCTGKDEKEYTPSDFSYSDLTLEELSDLEEDFEDID